MPLEVLKRVYGYERFHPLQEQLIDHVLEGKDALVLMVNAKDMENFPY